MTTEPHYQLVGDDGFPEVHITKKYCYRHPCADGTTRLLDFYFTNDGRRWIFTNKGEYESFEPTTPEEWVERKIDQMLPLVVLA